MAKKVTLQIDAKSQSAVEGFLKIVEAQKKTKKGMADLNSAAKNALKSVQDDMKKTGDSAKKTADDTDMIKGSLNEAATAAKGFVSGFMGIAGVAQLINSIKDDIESLRRMQKEMIDQAHTLGDMAYEQAALDNDVSDANQAVKEAELYRISRQSRVPVAKAHKALYMSKSVFGTLGTTAEDSAIVASTYSAARNLSEESTEMMPKLYQVAGDDSREDFQRTTQMVDAAASASGANPDKWLSNISEPLATGKASGYSDVETYSWYTTALDFVSPEQAKTALMRVRATAAGKTGASRAYFSGQAEAKGLDYASMTDPERFKFVQELYAEKQAAGTAGEIKNTIDQESYQSMQMLWSEDALQRQQELEGKISGAAGGQALEDWQSQTANTMQSRRVMRENEKIFSEAAVGRKNERQNLLLDKAEQIERNAKADATLWQRQQWRMQLWDRNKIADALAMNELNLAYEQAETEEEKAAIMQLIEDRPSIYATGDDDWFGKASLYTEGFNMTTQHGQSDWFKNRSYGRMSETGFNTGGVTDLTRGAIEQHVEALNRNSAALEKNNELMDVNSTAVEKNTEVKEDPAVTTAGE
jgi:hypothetical protein